MDIHQLRYFITAARKGNFTKAAEELFITRQALSKAVRNLEQETGRPLLVSCDGAFKLTEEGQSLFAEALPVVDSFTVLEQRYHLGEQVSQQRPLLSIALVEGAGMTLPTGFFDAFMHATPSVVLSIENVSADSALTLVQSEEAAIGLVGSTPRYLTDFEFFLVLETGTSVLVPRSNPLSLRASLSIEDVDGQPFVTFGKHDHLHRFFVDACVAAHVSPRIIMTASNTDVLRRTACHNDAFMFGFSQVYDARNQSYLLLPITLEEGAVFGTYAIKKKGATLSRAAQAFWEALKELEPPGEPPIGHEHAR